MNIRIGKHIPSANEIERLVQDVSEIKKKLAPAAVQLTAYERRQALKFRPGAERMVRLVARLARSQNFTVPKMTADDMLRFLEFVRRLEPLLSATTLLQRTIQDTLAQSRSQCWWGLLAYYAVLTKLSRADPALADSLAPVVEFFAHGPRNGSNKPPTAPPNSHP